MDTQICKKEVYANMLDIILKKIKLSLFGIKEETKTFKKIDLPKIQIDESELNSKFELFNLENEPVWEFSIKSWSN